MNTIFGGRLNTPLVGDANAFHPVNASCSGKNALFFGGRVDKYAEIVFSPLKHAKLPMNEVARDSIHR